MSRNTQKSLITIAELLEMQAGDDNNPAWINDDFEGIIEDGQPAKGKGPSNGWLVDPHNKDVAIQLSMFGGMDLSQFNGSMVHISGAGRKRTEYKNQQQVTLGSKTTVQVVGSGGRSNNNPPARGSNGRTQQQPQQRQNTTQGQTSNRGQTTQQTSRTASGPSPIHGATVGMAINQACENARIVFGDLNAIVDTPAYSKFLWENASDIIRTAARLERGSIAPMVTSRTAQPQNETQGDQGQQQDPEPEQQQQQEPQGRSDPAPRGRPQPGPDGSAFPDSNGIDEDVPF